eukprot:Gregarina_sp_Pseudo_9__324@NODE_120_length_4151_cov_23_697471_g112_i0_p2_GENE_NODE_120_length_4151_cov_23_697471_g112_i0NODE_120_length_4151_cov_23_697471_g112_i0_p2_ORF_typecomplete_len188_score46_79_NODE_120_length_4151_cov_23_697471_g112_i032893852
MATQNLYAVVHPEVLTPSTKQYIRQCVAAETLHSSKEVVQYSSVFKDPHLRPLALRQASVGQQYVGFPEVLCLENTPEITAKALCALRALQQNERVGYKYQRKDCMSEEADEAARLKEFAEATEILRRLNALKPFSVYGDARTAQFVKTDQKLPVMDARWSTSELSGLKQGIEKTLELWNAAPSPSS